MRLSITSLPAQCSLLLVLIGCSSTTVLQSVPSGAKLYVNEQYRGTTPYLYRDEKIVGSTTSIRLTLDGYKDFTTVLQRDERVHVGALVGGFFFVVPWLWVMQYDRTHIWEMQPLAQQPDVQEQLRNLKKLLDDGTITQEEYDRLSARLLDKRVSEILHAP